MVAAINPEKVKSAINPWYWAWKNAIALQGAIFSYPGHEYQKGPMECLHPEQCAMKGAQMTFTEINVLQVLWGMIHDIYPKGALYLFPTNDDVSDFSKARFQPLIETNQESIGCHVQSTDAANIKRIHTGMLYLRGARAQKTIRGTKRTSSKLKTVPVDTVRFDEYDEMDEDMVQLALERVSHSDVQSFYYLSTPTVPDFGIDKKFQHSDQRYWFLMCTACNKETCLELEFPKCIVIDEEDKGHRICRYCGKEIYPWNGTWRAVYPSVKETVGWNISQLNSIYVDPGKILKMYHQPPEGDLSEVMNSKLARAYIASTNKLTQNDVFRCCGQDPQQGHSRLPTAFGMDVGRKLHLVFGHPRGDDSYKIVRVERVSGHGLEAWNMAADMCKEMNARVGVIDMEPEIHQAEQWQAMMMKQYGIRVFLCDYQERQRVKKKVDEVESKIVVRRTQVLDATHNMIVKQGMTEIPRRCQEVERYALEMANTAKVLEQDPDVPGSKRYTYRKLGRCDYRHATVYFQLACEDPLIKDAGNYGDRVQGLAMTAAQTKRAYEAEPGREWNPLLD